jgi:hypothetical protein
MNIEKVAIFAMYAFLAAGNMRAGNGITDKADAGAPVLFTPTVLRAGDFLA